MYNFVISAKGNCSLLSIYFNNVHIANVAKEVENTPHVCGMCFLLFEITT